MVPGVLFIQKPPSGQIRDPCVQVPSAAKPSWVLKITLERSWFFSSILRRNGTNGNNELLLYEFQRTYSVLCSRTHAMKGNGRLLEWFVRKSDITHDLTAPRLSVLWELCWKCLQAVPALKCSVRPLWALFAAPFPNVTEQHQALSPVTVFWYFGLNIRYDTVYNFRRKMCFGVWFHKHVASSAYDRLWLSYLVLDARAIGTCSLWCSDYSVWCWTLFSGWWKVFLLDGQQSCFLGCFVLFRFLDSFSKETRIPWGKLPITSSEVLVKALFWSFFSPKILP